MAHQADQTDASLCLQFSQHSTVDNIKIYLMDDPFSAYDNAYFFQ
jgi:hypothetical protein